MPASPWTGKRNFPRQNLLNTLHATTNSDIVGEQLLKQLHNQLQFILK